MIGLMHGELMLDGLNIGPDFSLRQLRASGLQNRWPNQPLQPSWWNSRFPPESFSWQAVAQLADGVLVFLSLHYLQGVLCLIGFSLQGSVGQSFAEKKSLHAAWLEERLGAGPYAYSWGAVFLHANDYTGEVEIRLCWGPLRDPAKWQTKTLDAQAGRLLLAHGAALDRAFDLAGLNALQFELPDNASFPQLTSCMLQRPPPLLVALSRVALGNGIAAEIEMVFENGKIQSIAFRFVYGENASVPAETLDAQQRLWLSGQLAEQASGCRIETELDAATSTSWICLSWDGQVRLARQTVNARIDVARGAVVVDGAIFLEKGFLAAQIAQPEWINRVRRTALLQDARYLRHFHLPAIFEQGEAGGLGLAFDDGKLTKVHLGIGSRDATAAEQHAHHLAWLERRFGRPAQSAVWGAVYRYAWGELRAEFDPRSDQADLLMAWG